MPQMMPLNWILMFIQLTTIVSLVMILLYYTPTPTPPNYHSSSHLIHNPWKW